MIGYSDPHVSVMAGAGGQPAVAGSGAVAIGGSEATAGVGGGISTDEPWPYVSYSEPYRPQFHFSTAFGWMNDIDGLWYQEGTFHIGYQAVPGSFAGGKDLHWGHATSTDLLHWQQAEPMLVPGDNAKGEAWSGSVVVDLKNTSGLQTGTLPVAVAVFTATELGSSLAYSADSGATFQSYAKNPLAIGDALYMTNRDPALTWDAEHEQWVCAYWQGGTSFYTSKNLLDWKSASQLPSGDLVPDFYQLPLDGNANDLRWVLQNSGGSYWVGHWDGTTFTPDSPDARDIDAGPDYFAGRTFFGPSFPDARVVQMAWLKDGGIGTAPWRGSATFPVELGLRTFASGVKVTRYPIAEMGKLYTSRRAFSARTLAAKANLLAGIRSKTFDLELVIDTTKTTAKLLTFQIADQSLTYDFTSHLLQDAELVPDGGKLTLRILVDWSSLEVFGNGGELSWSAAEPFAPDDATLSLSGDADVALISAEFRQVGRAWPGASKPPEVVLDDADAGVTYSGAWSTVNADSTFFDGTCHYSTATASSIEATFTGTRIAWYGLKNTDLGLADVYIDDRLIGDPIDCYAPERVTSWLFSASDLPDGVHTIRLVARGDKNAASTGNAILHDYFISG